MNKYLSTSGDKIVKEYLIKNKYKILEKNYTTGMGHLDYVLKSDEGEIVFVEVRYKRDLLKEDSRKSSIKQKQRKCIFAGEKYIKDNKVTGSYRYDYIDIFDDKIEHLKNAF